MPTLNGWQHCPRCAADLTSADGEATCGSCGAIYYASSAPAAAALVLDDLGRVLLARRAREPHLGKWDTPGGFLEEGEDPIEAVRRELREETGLEVEPGAFVAAYADRYGDEANDGATLNLLWEATVVSGEPRPDDDVAELRWFALDALPPDEEIAFGALAAILRTWIAERQV